MEGVSSNVIIIKTDGQEIRRVDIDFSEDDVQLIEENYEVIVIDSDSDHDLIIDDNVIDLESTPETTVENEKNNSEPSRKKNRKRAPNKTANMGACNLNHKNIQSDLEVYLMKPSPKATLNMDEFQEVKQQLNLHAINSIHDGRWTNSFPIPGELLQVDSISFTPKFIKIVCANKSTAKWLQLQKCPILKGYRLVFK